MEQIECSETLAYKIETPGNYPKENILYSEHGESLKSRKNIHAHVFHCICRAPLMCLTGLSVYIVYNYTIQLPNCNMSWNCVVNVMTGLWAG
jgi:hypothetical protein